MVFAGAGSGKTRTLIARIIHLIESGEESTRIAALVFTRAAAGEIRTRVSAQVGPKAVGLVASTLHAWCMRLIRSMPQAFGLEKYTVMDEADSLMLWKQVRSEHVDFANDVPEAKSISKVYSFARNTLRSFKESTFVSEDDTWEERWAEVTAIVRGYEARKESRGYLDYDDLLEVVANQLAEHPDLGEAVGKMWRHILIDEVQDTNPISWKIIFSLAENCSLYCVGDPAQSIYGFRGADNSGVQSFLQRVPGASLMKLETNYRSRQEILDVANWLLSESKFDYGMKLVAHRGIGNVKPCIIDHDTEWDEARWVAQDIYKSHEDGLAWEEHLILARSSSHLRFVEGVFIEMKIPYRKLGGIKLLESAHVRDLFSLIRILANRTDELAWMRFLGLFPGVGEITAGRATAKILEEPNMDAALRYLKWGTPSLRKAGETIESLRSTSHSLKQSIHIAISLLAPYLEDRYKKNWQLRERDFPIIELLAESHESFSSFIEEYLLSPVYGSDGGGPGVGELVTISTIHSAKGLEASRCFIIGVNPGSFPHFRSFRSTENLEEERRLLYVACTRAKDHLFINRSIVFGGKSTHVREVENLEEDALVLAEESQAEAAKDAVEKYFLQNIPPHLIEHRLINNHKRLSAAAVQAKSKPRTGVRME